jgi:hypothetical protein
MNGASPQAVQVAGDLDSQISTAAFAEVAEVTSTAEAAIDGAADLALTPDTSGPEAIELLTRPSVTGHTSDLKHGLKAMSVSKPPVEGTGENDKHTVSIAVIATGVWLTTSKRDVTLTVPVPNALQAPGAFAAYLSDNAAYKIAHLPRDDRYRMRLEGDSIHLDLGTTALKLTVKPVDVQPPGAPPDDAVQINPAHISACIKVMEPIASMPGGLRENRQLLGLVSFEGDKVYTGFDTVAAELTWAGENFPKFTIEASSAARLGSVLRTLAVGKTVMWTTHGVAHFSDGTRYVTVPIATSTARTLPAGEERDPVTVSLTVEQVLYLVSVLECVAPRQSTELKAMRVDMTIPCEGGKLEINAAYRSGTAKIPLAAYIISGSHDEPVTVALDYNALRHLVFDQRRIDRGSERGGGTVEVTIFKRRGFAATRFRIQSGDVEFKAVVSAPLPA